MKKLSALDANFLYTETPSTPNHVASVQLFELPPGCTLEEFIAGVHEYFMARVHLVPYFTHKLKFTPGDIDHPAWVKDRDFDISNHFTQIELPPPGNFKQIEVAVAEIHSKLMDRSKPLWHVYLITGLANGQIAYYNQAHHACIDGMAGQAATMVMMDTTPEHPAVAPASVEPDQDDSFNELVRLSFENFVKFGIDTPNRVLGNMDAMARLTRRAFEPGPGNAARMVSAPATRFNRAIGIKRSWSGGEISIKELKLMAGFAGGKLNDVFLAACAGGLRRHLSRTDELPRRAMVAGCPVSLRKPGDQSMDNQVTMMNVTLATEIADPRLRLQTIIDSSREAKKAVADMAHASSPEYSIFGVPAMMTAGTRIAQALRIADVMPPTMNVVISNVPGPRQVLYSNRAKMLTHYPVSIPAHGLGLNITATGYVDELYFSVNACARAVPDAPQLRDDILAAYRELRELLLPAQNRVTTFPESTPEPRPGGESGEVARVA